TGPNGGRIQELTWEGELVRDITVPPDQFFPHHDLVRLPSGNLLLVAWEKKSIPEVTAAGRRVPGGLRPDCLIAVKPARQARRHSGSGPSGTTWCRPTTLPSRTSATWPPAPGGSTSTTAWGSPRPTPRNWRSSGASGTSAAPGVPARTGTTSTASPTTPPSTR